MYNRWDVFSVPRAMPVWWCDAFLDSTLHGIRFFVPRCSSGITLSGIIPLFFTCSQIARYLFPIFSFVQCRLKYKRLLVYHPLQLYKILVGFVSVNQYLFFLSDVMFRFLPISAYFSLLTVVPSPLFVNTPWWYKCWISLSLHRQWKFKFGHW